MWFPSRPPKPASACPRQQFHEAHDELDSAKGRRSARQPRSAKRHRSRARAQTIFSSSEIEIKRHVARQPGKGRQTAYRHGVDIDEDDSLVRMPLQRLLDVSRLRQRVALPTAWSFGAITKS